MFDPEDSPGSDKANDEMNREIVKASKMKDKATAMAHMNKIQRKHSKHGATDTEPREVISQVLNRVFGESVEIDEGVGAGKYSKMNLDKAKKLMGPSKNREQGIEFVMKGMKVSKKEATKLVDTVLDMIMKNEVELDEMKEPFAVVDTADGDKVVGTASSEKGAKEIITTAQLPPMKIKDKKTLKIVKVKKKQDIGYPLKEEVELDEAKEVLSRFKDDKLKKSIMNLATQKGLKVKEMGDKLEVSGNARKVMDLTLAVQKHDVKIEQNMMSAYTAAITKGVK